MIIAILTIAALYAGFAAHVIRTLVQLRREDASESLLDHAGRGR